LRKKVRDKPEELFHSNGNLKEKYNQILHKNSNNIKKNDINNENSNFYIEKIIKRQKPFFDLIDDIGDCQSQMNEIYKLLGQVINHLKSFLCNEEILTEGDSYLVRHKKSIISKRSSLMLIKNKVLNTMKKIKKHIKVRPNSVNKGIKEKEEKEEKEDNKIEINNNNNFYLFDCQEEKVILIFKRYTKLYQEFYNKKTEKFDIGKIPNIYDNIKYDIIHNKSIMNKDGYKLFNIVNKLACFLMPLEYGINIEEKYNIGIKLIKPLLTKIRNDLLFNNKTYLYNKKKSEDILQENKYNDITSNERNVKTRLYFTSQSHLYALFNTIIYGLNSFLVDDKNNMNKIWNIFDLDYCSHIVFRLFENFNLKENDEKRYRIEIVVSSGANKDPKLSDHEHMLSVNPWVVVNDHLTINDINKYFNFVLE
jgi:hypothetical protein